MDDPEPGLQLKLISAEEKKAESSRLINSVQYFVEYAFIFKQGREFRLIVKNRGMVLVDRCYSTYKGARIAFLRLFGKGCSQEKSRPLWSPFYELDCDWLNHFF
jgi:hypothetical protein